MLTFNCPHCDHAMQVPESAAGKSGKCKRCHEKVTVPELQVEPPPVEDLAETKMAPERKRFQLEPVSFVVGLVVAGVLFGAFQLLNPEEQPALNPLVTDEQQTVPSDPQDQELPENEHNQNIILENLESKQTEKKEKYLVKPDIKVVNLRMVSMAVESSAYGAQKPVPLSEKALEEITGFLKYNEVKALIAERRKTPETAEEMILEILLYMRIEANQFARSVVAKALGEKNFIDADINRSDETRVMNSDKDSIELHTYGKITVNDTEYDWSALMVLDINDRIWSFTTLHLGTEDLEASQIEMPSKKIGPLYMF